MLIKGVVAVKKISSFWLSPSYRCNNRCRWCYVGGQLALAPEASIEDVKRYITSMAEAGAKSCILVGGEPSIYPAIIDTIAFATSLGVQVKMMSNGRKLASLDFVRRLKDAGLTYCSISIEGTESVHDYVTRVPGSFQQSLQGIRNCQEVGIPINSITTVSTFNRDTLDPLLECLKQSGVRRAVFNMCSSQPSGYCAKEEAGLIELADYARIIEDVGLRHDIVLFYALIPLCLFDQDKLAELLRLKRLRVSCALFGMVVAVDPHGNLLPCTHMADVSYGNLNDPGALQVLTDTKEKEIAYLARHAPSEKCVDCALWNTCLGGCNLIWFSRRATDHIVGLPISV